MTPADVPLRPPTIARMTVERTRTRVTDVSDRGEGYMVSEKDTSPSPRRTFLRSLPLALRGSLSVVSST